MLILVEPVLVCVTCLFCVVVKNDIDGKKLLVGAMWQLG